MSEYTTREILDMIEANGGPQGLDLSGIDLRGIDLSRPTIRAEVERMLEENPEAEPLWWSEDYVSVHLTRATLSGADLRDAQLEGADLRFATLKNSELRAANLKLGRLWAVHLEGACLAGANMRKARLRRAPACAVTH